MNTFENASLGKLTPTGQEGKCSVEPDRSQIDGPLPSHLFPTGGKEALGCGSDGPSTGEGSGHRDLIRVSKVGARGQSVCEAGDSDPQRFEPLREVVGRRLTLDVRVGGDDDLTGWRSLDTALQLNYSQLGGANPLEWRDRPLEDMVEALKLPAALDGEHVERLLHDADHRLIPAGAIADTTEFAFSDKEATRAGPDRAPDPPQGVAELLGEVGRCPQAEEREPLRGLRADPGQPAELRGESLEGLGNQRQGRPLEEAGREVEARGELPHLGRC